jgi:hypothetical protein
MLLLLLVHRAPILTSYTAALHVALKRSSVSSAVMKQPTTENEPLVQNCTNSPVKWQSAGTSLQSMLMVSSAAAVLLLVQSTTAAAPVLLLTYYTTAAAGAAAIVAGRCC